MPTTNARYGRPKGSGVDDSRQLESIAALLAANPGLKPTTAIRSLGVEDPSVIRRLRDKFHSDQAKLLADARRRFRVHGRPLRAPPRCSLPRAGSSPACAPNLGSAGGDAARDYRR